MKSVNAEYYLRWHIRALMSMKQLETTARMQFWKLGGKQEWIDVDAWTMCVDEER